VLRDVQEKYEVTEKRLDEEIFFLSNKPRGFSLRKGQKGHNYMV